jgi:cobalt/nickel transport system ATP-binding protein
MTHAAPSIVPLMELHHAEFAWPEEAPCLSHLSLRIETGEKIVLLGANGGGKSTLLKLLNGLIFPQQGELRWQGQVLDKNSLRQRQFARQFRRACVLLFQHPEAMLFNPTVRAEIAYGPRQLGLDDVDSRVADWAEQLRLTPLLDRPPFLLSGGQKQKLALACLLVMEPELLLLDEPSASLDPATVGWLIDNVLDSPRAVLISTHNLSLAAELGERALVLGPQGRLLFDGPVEHALNDLALLEAANLAHRHRHRHGGKAHSHLHAHNWEPPTA